ncbi:MAG: hypothetical protein IM674_04255, partial [Brevundimonas sp.]|nr:hypothetical protein [Brevundimonas sp.]
QHGDYRNASAHRPGPNDGVVIDLAKNNRIQRLLDFEDIADDLDTAEEDRLVDYVKAAFELSHSRISKRYDHWKEVDRAHDVYVPPEATKFREKAVISDTRAVADTVLTYMMSALTGRNPMFQLEGETREARRAAAINERLLHSQMRKTGGEARIAQLLNDGIRYGFAPTKVLWEPKRRHNRIINFDPRRVFPDPRIQWGDFEAMQFCGFVSWGAFDAIARSGLYPKLAKYPALRRSPQGITTTWKSNEWNREEGRGLAIDPNAPNRNSDTFQQDFRFYNLGKQRVLNELWVRLVGPEVNLPGLEELWLIVTILDEEVCVRFQANPYGRLIPAVFGGFFFDSNKSYSQGLYDLILPMHNIATWLLRSRVDNVQAALNNLIFADPTRINVPDLVNRNPFGVVRTMPGVNPGEGIFVAQVPDVTRGHWGDIASLADLKQRVAAASDAQQGMPTADGVRTATEIARLTQLGSQRLGVISRIQSATTIRPLVHMMVSNLQDAIDYEGSMKVDPYNQPGILNDMVRAGYVEFTASDLQGPIEYLVIDGTLPTEPTRSPESWLNALQVLQNAGLGQEYNLGLFAEEAIRGFGIHDLDRFRVAPEQQGTLPNQQLDLLARMGQANVQPQDQIMNEVQKGNLVPMPMAQTRGRAA